MFTIYWKKLTEIGVNPQEHILEQRLTRLNNQITVIFIIMCIIVLVDTFISLGLYASLVGIPIIAFLTLPLYLSHKQKPKAARVTLLVIAWTIIVIFSYGSGDSVRLEYIFYLIVLLAVVFFNKDNLIYWIAFILLGYIICQVVYHYTEIHPLAHLILPYEHHYYFFASIIGSAMATLIYIKENQNYTDKIEALLLQVQEQNQQLLLQQQTILKQNNNLEKSNQELERFSYITSHDLKTPIRNVVSFAQLINDRLESYPKETIQRYLKFAIGNAKHAYNILEDILEFSKQRKTAININSINLNELIHFIKKDFRALIVEKNVHISTNSLETIHGDKDKISLLFQHLIDNAIKYNENDKIQIDIEYQQRDEHHIISIRDNGIGIAKEYQQQVFSLFKKLHPPSTYEGTGIGLALCEKIVKQHKGTLTLKSELGKGTQFIIKLPTQIF